MVALTLGIIILGILPSARAAPALQTDQPIYTLRDKQVGLSGSGFGSQNYYVWLKTPNNNHTNYTGTSFSPVSGGLIPPTVALPINADEPLGTYLLSISTSSNLDNQVAIAHFGLWGMMKPLYQRTESVQILGGGLYPGTSLGLSVRNPAGDYVDTTTIATNSQGDFNHTWRIPADAVTQTYKVIVDGTGTYDNAQQDYLSESRFTVTQATLSVAIVTGPSSTYQRTDTANVAMSLRYPDGSAVLKSKTGILPVLLLENQSTVGFSPLTLTDATNGIWNAQIKIPLNATLSSKYRFELPASSFDDGFGNKGGQADIFSDYFQIRNASLLFSSQLNGTQIQVPFGQVSIISKITYPDGTNFSNGTAMVQIFTGSATSITQLTYDPTTGSWHASYSSELSDLWRVGTWKIQVLAADTYGNTGRATYDATAQPYLFVALIIAVLVVALFGRWTISRYGRKVYFRVRKVMMRFRGPGESY
jgi:hypothetical protein